MAHITIHGSLDSHPILHSTSGDRKITEIRVIENVSWRDAQGASETREAGCYTVFFRHGRGARHAPTQGRQRAASPTLHPYLYTSGFSRTCRLPSR